MRVLRQKKWIALAAAVAAATVGVGVAVATVTTTVFADTTNVRLRVQRTVFVPSADQPVFSSGWHTHPGPSIIQVQSGVLRVTTAVDCRSRPIRPGDTVIEAPHVPLVVTSTRPATWTTTFIVPAGEPLSSPAADPCARKDDDDD